MAEPSSDDRIARLVHLVLEAVDQRLTEVRADLHQLGQRLDAAEQRLAGSGGAVAQAKASAADDERLDQLAAEVGRIRAEVAALAAIPAVARTAPVEPAPTSVAAPAVSPTLPGLTPLAPRPSLTPLAPTPAVAGNGSHAATGAAEGGELIDLDRLGDLLSERLGQLNLPRPS